MAFIDPNEYLYHNPLDRDINLANEVIKKVTNKTIRVGCDGDSITAYGVAGSSGGTPGDLYSTLPAGSSNRSYWQWGSAILGGVPVVTVNMGIGGQNSAQLLARWDTAGIGTFARNVDVISVMIGFNDFKLAAGSDDPVTGGSLTAIKARLRQIWERALAYGKPVVAFTITTPSSASTEVYPQRFRVLELNSWIKQEAPKYDNLYLVDAHKALADPASVDAVPRTSPAAATYDGTHPSGYGAWLIGVELAASLVNLFPKNNVATTSAADSYQYNANSNQLLDNPLLLGTGGAETGTGVSGDTATGCTLALVTGTATVVASKAAADDGYGEKQIITVSAVTGPALILFYHNNPTPQRLVAGDVFYSDAYVKVVSQTGLTRFDWYVATANSTTQTFGPAYSSLKNDSTIFPPAFAGRFRTPNVSFTGALTDCKTGLVFSLNTGGSLTVEISGSELRKLITAV